MTDSTDREAGDLESRVRALVEEVIQDEDLFIVDVTVRGQRGSRVVEVYLDSEESLDADRLAKVSREVEFLLDTEDIIAGRYNLNVSTPGADRPLTEPRQFRKHLGRTLEIEYRSEDADAAAPLFGDLLEVQDDAIVLSTGPTESVRILYQDIDRARVRLPW